MEAGFQSLLEQFTALGGIAENVCQREGENGRGIFPIDPSRRVKIMTPKNLLVNAENIKLVDDRIEIIDKSYYQSSESSFLENYYNDYSWGANGNSDSASFLKFIVSLPESIKNQLLEYGFVDKNLLALVESNDCLLQRFIGERIVRFEGKSVLAPIWEFVNHSNFAPPLRTTAYGVETPPIEPGPGEVLFKYSGKNSPISMWKKYGFSCDCIVAYSIPFTISLSSQAISICCSGSHDLGLDSEQNISCVNDLVSIKSLPIGCLSKSLPYENLKIALSSVGLPSDTSRRVFGKICEVNLEARRSLINSLTELESASRSQLCTALMSEVELISKSLII